jgi:hypothetical protein
MGRSGQLKATNDTLILELIASPLYQIKPDGTILTRIAKTGRVFLDETKWREAGTLKANGYRDICFKGKKLSVHRVIYAKFLAGKDGNPELAQDLVINHKDGNSANNSIDNLELITASQNNYHAVRDLGLLPTMGNHKITPEIADQIRIDRANGLVYKQLMAKYNLSKSSISMIINNKIWIPGREYRVA